MERQIRLRSEDRVFRVAPGSSLRLFRPGEFPGTSGPHRGYGSATPLGCHTPFRWPIRERAVPVARSALCVSETRVVMAEKSFSRDKPAGGVEDTNHAALQLGQQGFEQ